MPEPNINIEDIDTTKLNLTAEYYGIIDLVNVKLDKGEMISDEIFSWIINPPVIFGSVEDDELKILRRIQAERQYANKGPSLRIVRLIKKEFYEFLCTNSKYYQKERASLGESINVVITGLAAAIATKLGNIELGIVTTFVTTFMIVVAKMGKRVVCESFRPK